MRNAITLSSVYGIYDDCTHSTTHSKLWIYNELSLVIMWDFLIYYICHSNSITSSLWSFDNDLIIIVEMLFETYVGSYVFNPHPHVSGAEDYYNRFVCLSVCLSVDKI